MITTQLMGTEIVKHFAKVLTFCVVPHMSQKNASLKYSSTLLFHVWLMKWSAALCMKVSLTLCEVSRLIESSQSCLPRDLRSFKLIPCHIFPTSQEVLVEYPYITVPTFLRITFVSLEFVLNLLFFCHVDTVGQIDLLPGAFKKCLRLPVWVAEIVDVA